MTTSNFERNRCTRISPSAVLDDRLDGKDLEWARDHLRRCEACRERVEDFREMLLRVGRLPSATVGSAAMDQAFALSIPDRLRSQGGARSFEVAPAQLTPSVPAPYEPPQPVRPEVSDIPDLLTELEREIFRDEPLQDHPMPLSPVPEPLYPMMAARPEEIEPVEPVEPADPVEPAEHRAPLASFEAAPVDEAAESESSEPVRPEIFTGPLREVPVDSHRQVEFTDWDREPESHPEPAREVAPVPVPVPVSSNAVFAHEPAMRMDQESEEPAAAPPRKPDTAMRIAVGLGAAACVLLAAVLYEGGLLKAPHKASTAAAAHSVHPSPTTRASVAVSPSATAPAASVPAPTAPVLFTLGNGVTGDTMFRIRPGTAVAGYTRLVFDMHGGGLPTMIVSRPDELHVTVTFKDTNVTSAPVNGISSYHVTAVEPGVQQGPDGVMTIDLARPVRVTAFTLPATGGYAWRLVVDLHTN
jgi:hypothetical protein